MNLIEKYHDAFIRFAQNEAFFNGNKRYSYSEFSEIINGSRNLLEQQPGFAPKMPVGVLCTENAETYAAIFAIWFAGGYFVPLHPASPNQFNAEIVQKNNIRFVFAPPETTITTLGENVKLLPDSGFKTAEFKPVYSREEDDYLYVLNTSGSTGTPKNVPISLKNITAFVEGFLDLYPELNETDKFLQTYDLTADAAFTGYLVPLLIGAAVYTLPAWQFKPFGVAKMLNENPVSWVQVTPSLLACLHPFFASLWFPKITHFHFGGEALPLTLAEEWRKHIPNAEISNVYGPTETTVTATIYKCLQNEQLKSKNNIISIGKPLINVIAKISKNSLETANTGELLIGGKQVMNQYLFTDNQPFEILEIEGIQTKFYPSGDLVEIDGEGFLYYHGRKDDQVKINGYRVDLIEVENSVRELIDGRNVAAAVIEISPGLHHLLVFIENYQGNAEEILRQLTEKLPYYKIPEKLIGVVAFPLSNSGKTDRKKLVANYQQSILS
jgi:acyl-CoA synthetase (AMP-forming)/AMP-acid ligase II